MKKNRLSPPPQVRETTSLRPVPVPVRAGELGSFAADLGHVKIVNDGNKGSFFAESFGLSGVNSGN